MKLNRSWSETLNVYVDHSTQRKEQQSTEGKRGLDVLSFGRIFHSNWLQARQDNQVLECPLIWGMRVVVPILK